MDTILGTKPGSQSRHSSATNIEERHCSVCGTKLSRYNLSETCYMHTPMKPLSTRAPRRESSEIRKGLTPEDKKKIATAAINTGKTLPQLAMKFHIPQRVIQSILEEQGIVMPVRIDDAS